MAKGFGVLPGPVNRQQITSRLISSDENSASKKLTPRKKRERTEKEVRGGKGGEKAISKGNRLASHRRDFGGRFVFRVDFRAVALKSGETRNIATEFAREVLL